MEEKKSLIRKSLENKLTLDVEALLTFARLLWSSSYWSHWTKLTFIHMLHFLYHFFMLTLVIKTMFELSQLAHWSQCQESFPEPPWPKITRRAYYTLCHVIIIVILLGWETQARMGGWMFFPFRVKSDDAERREIRTLRTKFFGLGPRFFGP